MSKTVEDKVASINKTGQVTVKTVQQKIDDKIKRLRDALVKVIPKARMFGIDEALLDLEEVVVYSANRCAQLEADFWGLNERLLRLEAKEH